MATTKPRVNLTLEPEHYEILTRLAKVQGTSRARIINELFKEVVPQLESVVVTLEEAKAAAQKLTPEAKARLRAKMEGKEAEALEAMQELRKELDDGLQMGLELISQEIDNELNSGNEKA
jgi:uncharacterized protein (DUF1778 family)